MNDFAELTKMRPKGIFKSVIPLYTTDRHIYNFLSVIDKNARTLLYVKNATYLEFTTDSKFVKIGTSKLWR